MKHRRRNVLAEYRRLQRQVREIFDPFTERHCPACTTPCCIKPTRVTPLDAELAVGLGHTFPHLQGADPSAVAMQDAVYRLSSEAIPLAMHAELEPCDFLHKGRCTFPDDLRPFGCTVFICKPMYEHLPKETLDKLRRLIRQMESTHSTLVGILGSRSEP